MIKRDGGGNYKNVEGMFIRGIIRSWVEELGWERMWEGVRARGRLGTYNKISKVDYKGKRLTYFSAESFEQAC
jgi:hypothetical protein